MEYIFTDENQTWEFDFSQAVWATNRIHEVYQHIKDTILHDVDFVVEDKQALILVECKNANFHGVTNPKMFRPLEKDSINLVAKKYYDSLHFIQGIGKMRDKRLVYAYVIEAHSGAVTERKAIRNRLKDRLPFQLQREGEFENHLIDDLYVVSLDEWNEKYPRYPATRLK